MDSFEPETLALAMIVGAAAGVVRGITGFGGAMVMSPPLALLLGPRLMVPVALLLEGIAALPMVWETRRLVRWRVIGPIIVAAFTT
ncbi:MAG TPA: TSUP family transporter, partial [Burkholderiales bacterium]|nr:TSUP family transporter [Burkholderiales bacterium]